jgi:hypothetical protein
MLTAERTPEQIAADTEYLAACRAEQAALAKSRAALAEWTVANAKLRQIEAVRFGKTGPDEDGTLAESRIK